MRQQKIRLQGGTVRTARASTSTFAAEGLARGGPNRRKPRFLGDPRRAGTACQKGKKRGMIHARHLRRSRGRRFLRRAVFSGLNYANHGPDAQRVSGGSGAEKQTEVSESYDDG